jgi:hypothetical protein
MDTKKLVKIRVFVAVFLCNEGTNGHEEISEIRVFVAVFLCNEGTNGHEEISENSCVCGGLSLPRRHEWTRRN